MKVTNVIAALAVGATVAEAQFPGFNFAAISSRFRLPTIPAIPAFPGFPGSPLRPAGPPKIPGIPTAAPSSASVTKTVTGASSYGSFTAPIIPTIPPTSGKISTIASTASASVAPQATNDATHRGNWIDGYNITTDYSQKWPTTGVTVKVALTVSNVTLSPDGVPRQMLVFNGQYPGPLIEANWGDYIEVTVTNNLANNGTGIHWHGLRQLNTNLQDGAGGVTECPIAPGDTKVYLFQATQYGTTWYHSHFSVQYGDGVVGPMVIHGPASANYDIDLGTILVQDFYSQTAFQEDYYAHRHGPPTAINYLLNGQNIRLDGSSGTRSKWTFTAGKKHLLRFVNTSMDMLFKLQIDGHRFLVIQIDFVPITPYYTTELSISIGQRYMVIVEANQQASNYWLRAMAATDCSFTLNDGTGSIANGIVTYSNATYVGLPNSTYSNHSTSCVDEPMASLVPIVSQSVDSSSFQAVASNLPVNVQVLQATDGIVFNWILGGISQVVDWSNPTVGQAVTGNNSYSVEKHVVQLTKANTWTYWVIQNQFFVPHPFHLHGHDFNLLGQGVGVFDASTDAGKLNFANPPRRDVALLVASGWTVIAFQTDNPGAWLMHCHIAWHAGEGLSLQFLERPADIPALLGAGVSAASYVNTCKNWNAYAPTAVWKQYDSGLKKRMVEGMEVFDQPHLPPRANHGRRHSHAEGHVRRSRHFK